MNSQTKANWIALVVVIVAVIIVALIVWCARYSGGKNDANCGWSGSSGGSDVCTDSDDDDCEPRPRRCSTKNNSCGNWWKWAAVALAIIIIVVVCVYLWRSYCAEKPKDIVIEPCDRQSTNVTFVHDPPAPKIVGAVAAVCDDTGECSYVTTAANSPQYQYTSPVVVNSTLGIPRQQRVDLQQVLSGQATP